MEIVVRRHNVTTINYRTNLRCYYEEYGIKKEWGDPKAGSRFFGIGFRFIDRSLITMTRQVAMRVLHLLFF